MSRDVVLALIGASGAVLGAVAGGWSVYWASRIATGQTRDERRRQAYATFIIATDKLHRLWPDPAPRATAQAVKLLGPPTGQAYDAIQQANVSVMLAGPQKAENAANTARKAARDISECLNPPQLGIGHGSPPRQN